MRERAVLRAAAVLALALAPIWSAAGAAGSDTLTLTGTFRMDEMQGTLGSDLAAAFAAGGDHTWTLTASGTSYVHSSTTDGRRTTDVTAESFELTFAGPQAATLNQVVGTSLAGGTFSVQLRNNVLFGWSDMVLWVIPPGGLDGGVSFFSGHELVPNVGLFPADADGYPVATAEPFSFFVEGTYLIDHRAGNDGNLISWDDTAAMSGTVGTPAPPPPPPAQPSFSVADATVVEGDRGSRKVTVTVTLSPAAGKKASVAWRTVDGSATAGQDYTGASGTLSFKPGQTSKTISVSIRTDRTPEPDETFSVELTNASGAVLGDAVGVVTIRNDD